MNVTRHPIPLLVLLTLIGSFLHLYNLNWGAPFYFHPDERNVANAVTQLHFPDQMNPHFFAYGSLPIYTIYFTGVLINYVNHLSPLTVTFPQAIFISRFYSMLFATLLIPLLYLIASRLTTKQTMYKNTVQQSRTGLLAAFLATASVGFIQFAHFGTFEMWLTFFTVLLFWESTKFVEKKKLRFLFLMSLIFGILMAIKVSSLALLPIPLLAILLNRVTRTKTLKISSFWRKIKHWFTHFLWFFLSVIIFIFVVCCVYAVTNPFVFLDTPAFLSSMRYESGVGFNTVPVFYTGGFYDTIPVVYQFLRVYPFLLNPVITILFVFSFLYLIYKTFTPFNKTLLLLNSCFLLLFLSQSVLFIKWTRYMVPTLPFVYLIIALAITHLFQNKRTSKHNNETMKQLNNVKIFKAIQTVTISIIIVICSIFSLSYFVTAFVQPDTRIAALAFAKKTIPADARILSETHDLGNTVFNGVFPTRAEFNFYDYDLGSPVYNDSGLKQYVANSEYIILPSQRILQPRIENPKQFPKGHTFYTELLNGKLGYQKIYETPCDIFCKITYLGDPIYYFEQTANVFDRPTVLIFKKI